MIGRTLNLVAVNGSGFGDYLSWTPAIRAYKQIHPSDTLVLWTSNPNGAGEVFLSNTDISVIHYLPKGADLPNDPIHLDSRNAQEWGTRWAFTALGLNPLEHSRKIIYSPLAHERDGAIERIRGLGVDEAKKIVGLQSMGGWKTKRWPHWFKLGAALGDEWVVIILGREYPHAFEGDLEKSKGAISTIGTGTFRETVAMLPLLDVYVGFDSGLTFAAVAQRVPTVGLFGPHDPAGLVGDCDPVNFIAIREQYPGNCMPPGMYEMMGSCRTSGRYGQECPMRTIDGRYGPPCMSAISPSLVAQKVMSLPSWDGRPLDQRR